MPRRVHPNDRPENRDPNNLNPQLQLGVEDVLGEGPGARSIEVVWVCSKEFYSFFHSCCYGFITLFTAPFIAIFWGLGFACTAFDHIWCLTPIFKNTTICCGSIIPRCIHSILDCCITPWTNACGGIFVAFHKDIPEVVVIRPKPRQTKSVSRDKKNEDENNKPDDEKNKAFIAAPVVVRESSYFGGNQMQANKSIQRQLALYQ
ncbi:caveolin-2-like [Ostrea edulis]|uniref:caveolin-2-like n=1 Tax=Ostrea edulis TaxID=37623 RepID=UPI002095FC5C|nr:caveolin-2-like [Ostrea edulis]